MHDFKPIYEILDSVDIPDEMFYTGSIGDGFDIAIDMIRDRIEQLDVEETKDFLTRETAHWIISSDGYYPYCSACGYQPQGKPTRFCPECGKIMEGIPMDNRTRFITQRNEHDLLKHIARVTGRCPVEAVSGCRLCEDEPERARCAECVQKWLNEKEDAK